MANRPSPCECCGAPVGADGRYESSEEAQFIEEELERYEREVDPASVTNGEDLVLHRYNSGSGPGFVTENGERYERGSGSPSVTADALRQEIERLRAMPPKPGGVRWFRQKFGHEEGCLVCGGELPKNDRWWNGTPRLRSSWMYCSGACRQKAYRIRKKLEAQEESHDEA